MTGRKAIAAGLFLLSVGGCLAAEPWTLESALVFARTNSPDARIAQQRVAEAQAMVGAADSALWPRLQFQSSYIRTDNPMMVFGSVLNQRAYPHSGLDFNDVPDADNLNAKGLVSAPLYSGGKITAGRRAARAGAQAAHFDSQAVLKSLEFEVSRSFYNVWKTREFILAIEAALRSYQSNVSVAERRVSAGSLLRVDLLDIKVRLAQTQEDLVRARNARALSIRGLRTLLGLEDADFTVAETKPQPLRQPESSIRPDRSEVEAALQMEKVAEQRVKEARSGYIPRLNAFASLDYDYGFKFDNGGTSYTAGGMLQWDIWDGKLTRSKVNEATAKLSTAQEERRKLELNVGLEVERAQLDLAAAEETVKASQQAVEAAAQSAELNRVRFEAGQSLSTQWLDSETALVSARVRLAQSEADHCIAIAALRRALGLSQLDGP